MRRLTLCSEPHPEPGSVTDPGKTSHTAQPSHLPFVLRPICRALLAVGTLAAEHSKVRALARDLGFLSLADSIKASGSGKVAEVAAEVAAKLRL